MVPTSFFSAAGKLVVPAVWMDSFPHATSGSWLPARHGI
jgi:hypothetical protein